MRGSDSFAVLLRRRRRAAGLTQEELADRAHVSARTVSDMERGISRGPRRDTLALLAEALALTAAEREEFEASVRQAEPNGRASVKSLGVDGAPSLVGGEELSRHASPTNLPRALTSFIGREREQAAIVSLLRKAPLLTLTGAGGCGKTRLALRVAGDRLVDYPDGAWLVELAPLSTAALIPQAIAAALGVGEEPGRPLLATLIAFLRPKRLLLLLDNCEHLVGVCAGIATALLQACPRLQILATSREALGIAGEQVWRIPSLTLPDPRQAIAPTYLLEAEAARLFLDRARAVRPTFTLTEQNADLVGQVCLRLDGIPLAIELAAARLSALSLESLANRLDDRFRLLTGGSRTALPRQQTLRATLDWSYALLDGAERALLRRLAVFAGGWTLEAAEGVCAGEGIEGEVVDLLSGLVNKSLVVLDDVEEIAGRYRLLEMVRQYALEQLAASGEATTVRGQHLNWYLAVAERSLPPMEGEIVWFPLTSMEGELDNLRAALHWSKEAGSPARGLRLASVLGQFWNVQGHRSEGLRWLREFLALSDGDDTAGQANGDTADLEPASLRAWSLNWAAFVAVMQTETAMAKELAEQSLALFRNLGNPAGLAMALDTLGNVARDDGDFRRAVALQEECVANVRGLGNADALYGVLSSLVTTLLQMGDPIRAAAVFQECLARHREEDGEWTTAHLIGLQADIAWEQGDLEVAWALGERSVALFRQVGDRRSTAVTLSLLLGQVAREQDDLERALTLCEESLVLGRDLGDGGIIGWASLGLGLVACEQGDLVRARATLREGLSIFWAKGMKWYMARCLAGLTQLASRKGRAEPAARLAGATEALLALMGAPLPRGERAGYEDAVAAARAALGDDRFAVAWAAGQALPLSAAVAEVLDEGP